MLRTIGVALGAFLAIGAAAQAATVLSYGTEGDTTTMAPSFTAAGLTGDAFTAGAGIDPFPGASTFNFRNWDTSNSSSADAIADDEVWTWGFTSTQAYDLTDFSIRLDRSGTGPTDFLISLIVNGGSATSILAYDFGTGSSGVDFLNVDLSGFDNVTSAAFTLSAWGASSSAGTFDLEALGGGSSGDAFVLTGEVAVIPLPAGLPLLAGALGGLALMRRRRRR